MALTNKLSAIGDAIRAKTGKSELMTLDQMPQEIAGISSGGDANIDEEYISVLIKKTNPETSSVAKTVNKKIAEITEEIPENGLYKYPLIGDTLDKQYIESVSVFPKLTKVNSYGCNGAYGGTKVSTNAIMAQQVFQAPLLTTIKESAFCYTRWSKYVLPSLTTLENNAFQNCINMIEVNFPKLKTLNNSIFSYCSKLTKARFDLLESISATQYYYAPFGTGSSTPKLTALILGGNKVVSLSLDARVAIGGTSQPTNSSNHFNKQETLYIYVPKAMIEEYKSATNWTTISDYIRAIEDYPEICGEVS